MLDTGHALKTFFVLFRDAFRVISELWSRRDPVALFLVAAFLFKVYVTTREFGRPEDFGDEIPGLIILVVTILNRFI